MRGWLFRRTTLDFQSDRHGEIAPTLAAVISSAASGSEFTAMLVPEGTGARLVLDRDSDGYLDASEVQTGFNPADPLSHPGEILSLTKIGGNVSLSWQSAPGAKYVVESAAILSASSNAWSDITLPFAATSNFTTNTHSVNPSDPVHFYRVRMQP